MTDNQKKAYEWAKKQDYPSVAARYAKELAGLVDDLQAALRQQDVTDKDVGKNPGWISVKDRMPEPDVNVLVRCFYHECWQTLVCHMSKRNIGRWYTKVAGQWVQISHWMPLPEPPEEGTV